MCVGLMLCVCLVFYGCVMCRCYDISVYCLSDAVLYGSHLFEAGWLVVKAQWYQLETVSPRCYSLQTEERHLVVSEMIRLSGIRFDKVVKRSPRLGFSEFYLGEDTHNRLENCVREQVA